MQSNILTFDVHAGSSINWAIREALKMAVKYQRRVRFYFNGCRMTVHKRLSPKHIYNQWQHMMDSRSIAYRQTQEYRDQEANTNAQTERYQRDMTALFRTIDASFATLPTLLGFMANLSDCGDWIPVDWNKAWAAAGQPPVENVKMELVKRMEALGYIENEGCVPRGSKFDDSTADKLGRYIAGQCINMLRIGMPPHHVVQRFTADYLTRLTNEQAATAAEQAKAEAARKPVCPDGYVDISNLDKAEVLVALYNGSRQQGMGYLHASGASGLSLEDARALLEQTKDFDYLRGRVMKINLSKDSFNPWGYDRDIGQGAAARIVADLVASKRITPPPAEVEQTVEDERQLTPPEDAPVVTMKGGADGDAVINIAFPSRLSEKTIKRVAAGISKFCGKVVNIEHTPDSAVRQFTLAFEFPIEEITAERVRSAVAANSRGDCVLDVSEDRLSALITFRRFTPSRVKGLLELADRTVPVYMSTLEELRILNSFKDALVADGCIKEDGEIKAQYNLPIWLTAICGYYGVSITKKLTEEEVNEIGDRFAEAENSMFPYPDMHTAAGQFVTGMLLAAVKAPKVAEVEQEAEAPAPAAEEAAPVAAVEKADEDELTIDKMLAPESPMHVVMDTLLSTAEPPAEAPVE